MIFGRKRRERQAEGAGPVVDHYAPAPSMVTVSRVPPSTSTSPPTPGSGAAGGRLANPARGFAMRVEDIFSITGRGTVVTGTVESGEIRVGEAVKVSGNSGVIGSTVRAIEAFRRHQDVATAGQTVGILLAGVGRAQVQRGDLLIA